MSVIFRLLKFLHSYWGWVLLSILLGTATIASNIGLLGTSAYLISRAALQPSIAELQVAIVGVRFFGISRAVFRYMERLVSHSVNFHLLSRFRVWFYQKIEPLSPACLSRYESGDLLASAVGDIETLDNFYVRVVGPSVVFCIVTLGMGLFTGYWGQEMGLIFFGGLLATGVGTSSFSYLLGRESSGDLVKTRAELSGYLVKMVQGIGELIANGREKQELNRINLYSQKIERIQTSQSLVNGIAQGLNMLGMHLTLWAILLVAAYQYQQGKLDGVMLGVFVLLTMASFEATSSLGPAAQHLNGNIQAGKRLCHLAERTAAVISSSGGVQQICSTSLEFKNLSFRYADDHPGILKKVDFTVPAGCHAALVGPSGSGKSTIFNLLLRFWDYKYGDILMGGVSLKNLDPEAVRSKIGLVSQHTHLFSDSVRNNLLIARRDASDQELMEVIKACQLDGWFSTLPEGLDTWIGELGLGLSGGERQRLAIARVLLKKAEIVLADEPTAHLDMENEKKVIDVLLNVTQNKSLIWITHNLLYLNRVEKVIVLEKGEVCEQGGYKDLIISEGKFQSMLKMQKEAIA